MTRTVSVAPRAVLQSLLLVILALTCAHLVVVFFFSVYLQSPLVYGLVPLFNMDAEANVPTYFSTLLLAACALVLAIIAALCRREGAAAATRWAVLAIGFLYLSVDEAAAIHELVSRPTWELTGARRLAQFAWLIPALIALLIVAVAYLRFLIDLPPRTRRRFLLAAALYLGGAVGMEALVTLWIGTYTSGSTAYLAIATVEEVLEMTGAAVFLYALLDYLQAHFGTIAVRLGPAASESQK